MLRKRKGMTPYTNKNQICQQFFPNFFCRQIPRFLCRKRFYPQSQPRNSFSNPRIVYRFCTCIARPRCFSKSAARATALSICRRNEAGTVNSTGVGTQFQFWDAIRCSRWLNLSAGILRLLHSLQASRFPGVRKILHGLHDVWRQDAVLAPSSLRMPDKASAAAEA